MEKKIITGITVGKNTIVLGLIILALVMAGSGIYALCNDLSYMNILELIKYLTYGSFVLLGAEGLKAIKIK